LKVTKPCAAASTSVVPLGDVRDAPRALEGLVVDVVACRSRARMCAGLGVAHEVQAQVHHVQQIDERAARTAPWS
jgi:hypothetical protein